jgi:hypothetical protein
MTRNFLNLGTFFAASALALLPVACGGKVVSSPGNEARLEAVSVTAVSGTIVECQEGFAHPNVCCEQGEGTTAACGVYAGAPFQACDSSHTTFPDPRSCCPLDGSSVDCVAPPRAPAPPPICGYACPVGQYQPEGASPGTCCFNDGDVTACSAPACGGGCACACESGEPCPPCNCPEEPACPAPTPKCGACPTGWQVPSGEPYLCCSEGSDGAIACFSQGVPPSSPLNGVNPGGPSTGTVSK